MEIVEIKVERLFLAEFQKCVAYALSEFGRKTVKNWNAEYEKIRHRLEIMPTGYPSFLNCRNGKSIVAPSS